MKYSFFFLQKLKIITHIKKNTFCNKPTSFFIPFVEAWLQPKAAEANVDSASDSSNWKGGRELRQIYGGWGFTRWPNKFNYFIDFDLGSSSIGELGQTHNLNYSSLPA